MKKLVSGASVVIVIVLVGTYAFTLRSFAQDKRREILYLPVRNVHLRAANIGLILSRLSDQHNIPIGFEVATDDDLSITRSITIDIKEGTVEEVLNAIVNQNQIYVWEIRDDVVNVFPRERNRDGLLKEILETRLERISIDKHTSRFNLRQKLCESAAVTKILSHHNVIPDNETFTSRDFGKVGRDFSFVAENISVVTIMNNVIRSSQTKYWIIMRYGDKKQYLVLNL